MCVNPLHIKKFTIPVSTSVGHRWGSCHMWSFCFLEAQYYSAVAPHTGILSALMGDGWNSRSICHQTASTMHSCIHMHVWRHPFLQSPPSWSNVSLAGLYYTPLWEVWLIGVTIQGSSEVFPQDDVQQIRDLSADYRIRTSRSHARCDLQKSKLYYDRRSVGQSVLE
jgi:hypothetical protein